MICLPKLEIDKFKQALKNGDISPGKLTEMTSAERRALFADVVSKENAANINALFESKLLLKNQKAGMVAWAKKVANGNKKVENTLLTKVEKMEKFLAADEQRIFLEDLASQKLGAKITYKQADHIVKLSKETREALDAIPNDSPIRSTERIKYGLKYNELIDYTADLKTHKPTLKEIIKSPTKQSEIAFGTTKSLVASLDNSFIGRQGIWLLYNHPVIWTRTFLSSWKYIGKELVGKDAMALIKADVVSRPNAINGKFAKAKMDVRVDFEEAFPSEIPRKIPVLGRLYGASESAFNGSALRMRADYGDLMIKMGEEFGLDFNNKNQAVGVGRLVNSMTGRGHVGLSEGGVLGQKNVNAALFSIKFLKSNFDKLTMHRLGYGVPEGPGRAFVRREAAKNLARAVTGTAVVLYMAQKTWGDDAVELDPRSSDFGKIKIGDTRFDISGGSASMITLASRMLPSMHNGKWGTWYKNSSSGAITQLNQPGYGKMDTWDVFQNFASGKLSPTAGALRDAWKGEHFGGEEVTPQSTARKLITPISVQNYFEVEDNPDAANVAAVLILDGLGIGASTY